MGTKKNPGAFDCMKKAEPNEPYFVLLGRDIHAANTIRRWVELSRDEHPVEKLAEALQCAEDMEHYRIATDSAIYNESLGLKAPKAKVTRQPAKEAPAAQTSGATLNKDGTPRKKRGPQPGATVNKDGSPRKKSGPKAAAAKTEAPAKKKSGADGLI